MAAANQQPHPREPLREGSSKVVVKGFTSNCLLGGEKKIVNSTILFECLLYYPLYCRQNDGITPAPHSPIVSPPLPTLLHLAACCWLVVVCKIIDQRPSKARVYYIFVLFVVRISAQTMVSRVPRVPPTCCTSPPYSPPLRTPIFGWLLCGNRLVCGPLRPWCISF